MVDWVLFAILGVTVVYLFVYALFSMSKTKDDFPQSRVQHPIVVLIPAYKGDAVIRATVDALLAQDYPRDKFEIVVIADKFRPETLDVLRRMPVHLMEVAFEQSSKAKALGYAVEQLGDTDARIVAILDVDNVAASDFLRNINNAYDSGSQAMQCHRMAKNRDTDTAVLDAASEEINNSIFRAGHVALGLSSALIGSGMAFDYDWFRRNVGRLVTSGEDKELEVLLLKERIYIDYLSQTVVLDEKIQQQGAFYNQRRRWLAAQFYTLWRSLKDVPEAIVSGNVDYFDKLWQWCMPPRIVTLGLIPIIGVAMLFVDPVASVKWLGLLVVLLFAFAFALPDSQMDDKLRRALRRVPILFILMVANMFRLRGANDRFIHTSHEAKETRR